MRRGGTQRTYSMWSLLGVFAVIGLVGLVGVLMVGSPRTPTVQLAGTQTLDTTVPGESASGAGTGSTSAPSTTTSSATSPGVPAPSVTVPGGAAAPTGVNDVLRTEDSTSFTFDVPPEMTSGSAATVVPPTRVAFSADGNAVSVSVSCAVSAGEVLALMSVTEAEGSVTVLAVVLVPGGGPPCDPAAPPREITVPLAAPAAGRALTVVPSGTAVPGFTTT